MLIVISIIFCQCHSAQYNAKQTNEQANFLNNLDALTKYKELCDYHKEAKESTYHGCIYTLIDATAAQVNLNYFPGVKHQHSHYLSDQEYYETVE